MRTQRDQSSPWGWGVWFEEHEFDSLMDEARERAGTDLFSRRQGVDVEALLLRVYGLSPDFAADLPEAILGRTLFASDGRIEIQINRALSDAAETDTTARHRLRSTLAHECAHVVEHAHLQIPNGTLSLFGQEAPTSTRILCRATGIQHAGAGQDWWEYQANRGMASLLLPKPLLKATVPDILAAHAQTTFTAALTAARGREVIAAIADWFDTSFEMTLYRLQGLGYIPDARQGTLTAAG